MGRPRAAGICDPAALWISASSVHLLFLRTLAESLRVRSHRRCSRLRGHGA